MPVQPDCESLVAENQQLVLACADLRAENDRLRQLLQSNGIDDTEQAPPSSLNDASEADCLAAPILLDESVQQLTKHSSNQDKVTLFHSLFCGRPDVYARQWKGKGGKPGYSPACKNEWIRGVCGKPKTKCSSCKSAAYLPYDATAIEQHLRGQCVVGIYPLLTGDTCSFLAIDFDEAAWRIDVSVVAEICKSCDIPHAIEISRSGNGAHLWFFFDKPLPASIARNFGTAILTQAMQKHAKLSFSSYDRMFPNQDTMPKGGFGNLIALPLQKEARAKGNSQFVDTNFTPYEDQWAFLSSVQKISASEIESWIATWHIPPLGDLRAQADEDDKPWKHDGPKLTLADCPPTADCTLADMLYISTDGFSDKAQNQIKRLAAFRNPLFYQAQAGYAHADLG